MLRDAELDVVFFFFPATFIHSELLRSIMDETRPLHWEPKDNPPRPAGKLLSH